MKYYCLLSILLFSLIACGSSDDKEPQSEDVTIKCSPEKIEAVAQASQYVVNVVCSDKGAACVRGIDTRVAPDLTTTVPVREVVPV